MHSCVSAPDPCARFLGNMINFDSRHLSLTHSFVLVHHLPLPGLDEHGAPLDHMDPDGPHDSNSDSPVSAHIDTPHVSSSGASLRERVKGKSENVYEVLVWGPWAAAEVAGGCCAAPGNTGCTSGPGGTAKGNTMSTVQEEEEEERGGGAGGMEPEVPTGAENSAAAAVLSGSTMAVDGSATSSNLAAAGLASKDGGVGGLQLCCRALGVALGRVLQHLGHAQELGQQGQHGRAAAILETCLRGVDELHVPIIKPTTGAAVAAGGQSSQQLRNHRNHVTLRLGPNHWLRTQLLAALMKACIDWGAAEAWPKALEAARQLEQPYRLVYPRYVQAHELLSSGDQGLPGCAEGARVFPPS
jgi:hypothetical protein